MSQKRWKLVVSELGQATTLHEVVVEAGDWMTALTRARAQIGERGGVPPGASCQIAPDGTANITDAVARRRYLVGPTNESSAPPAAVPAPVVAPAVAAPLSKKQKNQTMAYMPSPHAATPSAVSVGAPAPASQPPGAQSLNRTVSYSTAEVRAAAQAVAASTPVAPIASAPAPVRPASVPPPASVMPAAAASAKKISRQTMAYMPPEAMKAVHQAVAAAQAPVAAAPVAAAPVAAAPVAAAPVAAAPVAAAPVAAAPSPATPSPADTIRTAAPSFDDGLELLHQRDAEPSKESPLVYRERHYLLPQGKDVDEAEMLLRRRFAALREELSTRPKGKLVKMALFDHRWSGQPTRPPVLALQWKDWRGEPEITAPSSIPPASGPVMTMPPVGPTPSMAPATVAAPIAARAPQPEAMPSIMIDPSLSEPPPPPAVVVATAPPPAPPSAPSAPPAPPSIVVDPSLSQPFPLTQTTQRPVSAPPAPVAAQPAAPQSATGSSKRSRKATPGAGLADDRLADAFEGLQDLFFLTSAFEGVEFTMRLIKDLIPCEASSIALYDINSHELRFVSTTGTGADERKADAIPTTAGLVGVALGDWNHPLSVSDVASDARFDPGIDGRVGLDLHNMLLMPVAAQGRLLALVQLINRTSDLDFSKSDANLIAYITSRLGEFLIQTKMAADRPSKAGAKATRSGPR